jgi:cysteinyl-tRNA synthetase
LKEAAKMSKSLKFDRETLRKITDPLLLDDAKAAEFVDNYRKLRRMYEFLGAHPERLKYQDEFVALTEIYYTYLHRKRDFEEIEKYVKKYFPKTLEIVQNSFDLGRIEELFPVITLDESYLRKLEETYPNLNQRVFNMMFDLRKFVYVEKSRTPYLETIGERISKILREVKERKIKTEEAFQKLKELATEINDIQQRKRELNDRELSILLPLEKITGKSKELVDTITSLTKDLEKEGMLFPGWNQKSETTRKTGLRIRAFIRKLGLTFEDRERVFQEIMKGLSQVG